MTSVVYTEYSYPRGWKFYDYDDYYSSPLVLYGKNYEEIANKLKVISAFHYGCRIFNEDIVWDWINDIGYIYNFQGKIED